MRQIGGGGATLRCSAKRNGVVVIPVGLDDGGRQRKGLIFSLPRYIRSAGGGVCPCRIRHAPTSSSSSGLVVVYVVAPRYQSVCEDRECIAGRSKDPGKGERNAKMRAKSCMRNSNYKSRINVHARLFFSINAKFETEIWNCHHKRDSSFANIFMAKVCRNDLIAVSAVKPF